MVPLLVRLVQANWKRIMTPMRVGLYSIILCLPLTAAAAELPTTETRLGSLALPVLPDSLVVSPDSSRLAFAAKEGDPTLLEKGIVINPETTDPRNDSAKAVPVPIRLIIDEKSTIGFDTITRPVFSPNSQRVAYAGQNDKKWQLIVDGKPLATAAEGVPEMPMVFSPNSAHVAWAFKKGEQYQVTVDDRPWPALGAVDLGRMAFSPDSAHLAVAAYVANGWKIFVDARPLPIPAPAAGRQAASTTRPMTRPAASQPAEVRFPRFGQWAWWPDSTGLAFHAGYGGSAWTLFSQSLDGTVAAASKPFDGTARQPPAVSADGQRAALPFLSRNKWAVATASAASPSASAANSFDAVWGDSVGFYEPPGAAQRTSTLLYLGAQNKQWRLYVDDRPAADSFDTLVQGSFTLSPDKHHFVFAGKRGGKTTVIKDGTPLANHDECGAATFAFSPDSQHVAYAARNGPNWSVCVDGKPGAPFNMLTGSPIAFSPDSSRVAFVAMTADKTWHLVVGQNGALQSKPYDAFLKGSRVDWRHDGTVVTIAIQKKVATRIVGRP
jgi:hypothetical protein